MGHFAQSGTVTLALLGDIWVNVAFLTASNEWFNKYLMPTTMLVPANDREHWSERISVE